MQVPAQANLLLVDDRPENLVALEAILEPLGQNLVRANSGTEALKRLLTDEFAVILLDVQMPIMDGFETAALIKEREKSRHIPIIFVTAISKEERYVFQGYSAGAVDYIAKPFDPTILRSKVMVFVELFQKSEQIKRQAEMLRRSEQREAERQLLEREREMERRHLAELTEREAQLRQFKATLDATQDGVFIFDPDSLRYDYANQGALRLTGYSDAEIQALTPLDLLQEFDEENYRLLTAPLRTGAAGAHRYEAHYRRKDGSAVPVEISLQFIASTEGAGRFVSIVRDITERKQAEATLAAAFERERRIAKTLTHTLLMEPPEGAFPGLDVVTFYEAAWEEASFGGDFFDTFALPGGRVALVVGDASGKGLVAAARNAEVKYALRAFLREHGDPARAVARLNSTLCDSHQMDAGTFGAFICLSLVVVDTVGETATFVVAGTEPPLVLRQNGVRQIVENGGLPLGINPEEKYAGRRLRLAPQDTVLLLTDGITEARSGKDLFGYDEMMRQALQAADSGSPREIGQAVLSAARGFAGGKLQDDACLLLARRQ